MASALKHNFREYKAAEAEAVNRSKLSDILTELQNALAKALVCETTSAITLRVSIKQGKLGSYTIGAEKRMT